jgi:tRNA (cytidine/uridine-2'-O-)-methyltransferase
MFNLILFEPEIPPNTGNIIRLCANTGVSLHLVKPLGFPLEDKKLRRAGLDYHEYADMKVHESWEDCLMALADKRLFAVSTRGTTRYDAVRYEAGDCFILGPETRGLPKTILESFVTERRLRLPMRANSRSLNLANSAAVLVYEAWRQHGFSGGT